jgi:hypothetical protein
MPSGKLTVKVRPAIPWKRQVLFKNIRRATCAIAPIVVIAAVASGATVNLSTGKVSQFGAGVSIAYFNPGCGADQDAVLTQGGTGASAVLPAR